jgi:para-nitrobenzyl esterase
VLTGSNADEYALFLVPTGAAGFIDDGILAGAISLVGGDPEKVGAAYRTAQPDATPGELLIAAVGDWFFRIPAIRVAEARQAQGAETFVYEFLWRSPQFDGHLGSCHALEIGFVFDNLDDPLGEPLTGSAAPQPLADEMHAAWVAFVKTGSPGWAPYGSQRIVRQFDEVSATVNDPASAQRLVWEGVR